MSNSIHSSAMKSVPEYADHQYQEAVGRLKELLVTSGGSEAGSGYSQRIRPDVSLYRAHDFRSQDFRLRDPEFRLRDPEVRLRDPDFRARDARPRSVAGFNRHELLGGYGRFRHDTTSSYKQEASFYSSLNRHDLRSRRPEALDLRSEVGGFRPDSHYFRSEIPSFRSESLERYRPLSALEHVPRRYEHAPLTSSASLRGESPARRPSVQRQDSIDGSLKLKLDNEDDEDGDEGGEKEGKDDTPTPTAEVAPQESFQMRELRQYALRQEELVRQLEQENGSLRQMSEELRTYVRELVAENDRLADEARTRTAEATSESDSKLESARAEVARLTSQLKQQENQLTNQHQRHSRQLSTERDQLIADKQQLKLKETQATQRADEAEKKSASVKTELEHAQKSQQEAENTANQLRRDLEERDRQADRRQMEHERHLLAARGQAERGVRAEIDKLQRQIDSQTERIAELEYSQQQQQYESSELRAAATQHQQMARQARDDADSAATRHRRELDLLHSKLKTAEEDLRLCRMTHSNAPRDYYDLALKPSLDLHDGPAKYSSPSALPVTLRPKKKSLPPSAGISSRPAALRSSSVPGKSAPSRDASPPVQLRRQGGQREDRHAATQRTSRLSGTRLTDAEMAMLASAGTEQPQPTTQVNALPATTSEPTTSHSPHTTPKPSAKDQPIVERKPSTDPTDNPQQQAYTIVTTTYTTFDESSDSPAEIVEQEEYIVTTKKGEEVDWKALTTSVDNQKQDKETSNKTATQQEDSTISDENVTSAIDKNKEIQALSRKEQIYIIEERSASPKQSSNQTTATYKDKNTVEQKQDTEDKLTKEKVPSLDETPQVKEVLTEKKGDKIEEDDEKTPHPQKADIKSKETTVSQPAKKE